ncbi:MAG: sigma-70 family RNA polymerase sigma factor [Alphaproteobacteria bacterium]|nr:sigma-70 family RNA polymerase sigma factor [Alphaproteobacteria bacterium]
MDASTDSARLAGLVARVAAHDRAAFGELYAATRAKLFGVVRRILIRGDLAEEALQESYVRIWSNAHRYEPGTASAMTWMVAIARNQAIDVKRRAAERMSAQAVELDDVVLTETKPSAEDTADLRRLRNCLGGLGDDNRDMVLLAYHQGYSREELAEKFARPVATVKTILRRSLMLLKECLDGRA